ncbi:MAG: DnaJ domain-containing protein [Magnetococcales bacterium]|nr:DnaJ domain-containing protein [Magnetococcales bacterium]
MNPFDVLGLTAEANDAEIRKAYLVRVKEFSPEQHPERFKEIRAAFEAISDQRRRIAYSLFGKETADFPTLLLAVLRREQPHPQPVTKKDWLDLLSSSMKEARFEVPGER